MEVLHNEMLFGKPDLSTLKPRLHETVLFHTLSDKELETVIKYAQLRSFTSGDHVFFEGDKGSALFIVLKGTVEIVRHDHGKHVHIATLNKGAFFGELALVYDTPRTATALAIEDTLLVCIFKHDLEQLVKHYPMLGTKMQAILKQIIEKRVSEMVKKVKK
jgi:CRP-like cAMP-binding protein